MRYVKAEARYAVAETITEKLWHFVFPGDFGWKYWVFFARERAAPI